MKKTTWKLLSACGAALLIAGCGGGGGGGGEVPTVRALKAGGNGNGNAWSYTPRARQSAVPAAEVVGPIAVGVIGGAARDYPQLATQADLAANGYVEEEYFFEGVASRYATPTLATGSVASTGYPYKSRMLVRRPKNGAKFNGTVVVEWVNVTSGYNLDALWQGSADFFMRHGYVYVGVSAQRNGVHLPTTGLISWSPGRYGTLDITAGGTVTDDSLSYDIFAQAARAIATPGAADPLKGLAGRRILLAAGVSQSEGRLVTYYNSIEPLHRLFDGYYMFLGLGGQLRTDIDVKMLKINTENDVLLLGEGGARQADSDRLRTWEIAGTSHVSYGSTLIRTPLLLRDGLPVSATSCNLTPFSRVSPGPVLNNGYPQLVDWIADGTAPAIATRIELVSAGRVSVAARDAYGNALGGIRLPDHDVATATNTGVNSGAGFCILYGSYLPFDAATLHALYPTHASYVDQVTQSARARQAEGLILAEDAKRIIQAADVSSIPD